jgi:Rad3-related DNA helicase
MLSVPDAAFKLTQACGRLLRTEQDAGRITILDRRLVSKRYGSQLLDALPGFRRVIDQGPVPATRAPRAAKAGPTQSLFPAAPAAG